MMSLFIKLYLYFLRAWGLRDIYIITWNFCHASCGTCSGPNSNECTTCRKGNALIAPFNGYCACPGSLFLYKVNY